MTLNIEQPPCLITNTIYSFLIPILFMVASSFTVLSADFILILTNHLYFFHKNHFLDLLIYYPIDKIIWKLSESRPTAEMGKLLSYLQKNMAGKSMWHFIVFDVINILSPLQWYTVQSLFDRLLCSSIYSLWLFYDLRSNSYCNQEY